jgi:hypothetical protein
MMTPLTPVFPPQFALPTTSNLSSFPRPSVTPHGRQSFPLSEIERRHYQGNEGPSTRGRPQIKERHSGSTLISLREQELQQPSWFESNYTVVRSLGQGAFSDAYEVSDHRRDGVYAVKRTKNPFGGPKDR